MRCRDRLRCARASVLNVLDQDVSVLGGGVSSLRGLAEKLPDTRRPYMWSQKSAVRVVRARFGDSSGVRGAARLSREVAV